MLSPQNVTNGNEQHEYYYVRAGRKSRQLCQYDYRHTDGTLFSCVKPTLAACVAARDEWLADRYDEFEAARERIADEVIDHQCEGSEE